MFLRVEWLFFFMEIKEIFWKLFYWRWIFKDYKVLEKDYIVRSGKNILGEENNRIKV